MILGIDEVGRGPWAGPLVVGAVVLGGTSISGLNDSKKLTKKKREILDIEIREKAGGFGLGWVHASEIDKIGLSAALKLATKRAVEQVTASYHEIIIDGTINFLSGTNKGKFVKTLAKADQLIPSVSAASIIAKVARDAYMAQQDTIYPGYSFSSHVGYGTAAHIAAISALGVTPLHRLSVKPLAKYANIQANPELADDSTPQKQSFSTKQIGDSAEVRVAEYLRLKGHDILKRNWKTKFCEIDIISQYKGTVYFTEVKHRKSSAQGGGVAAITPKKLRQMKFAAEYYALKIHRDDLLLELAVATTSGVDFVIDQWMTII